MTVKSRPLTREAYARFGEVIAAGDEGEGSAANQGTARRFDRLAALENLREGATPNVCVFRSMPWLERPIPIRLLEKHPESTQVFVPMNARRFLVVVALGDERDERPDLTTLAAFIATGKQGVSYRPGVWHHPLIALDDETDFACLVFEDGSKGDCVSVELGEGATAIEV
jgi:ureidoglycolate lyase